jgi:hypothetical protein
MPAPHPPSGPRGHSGWRWPSPRPGTSPNATLAPLQQPNGSFPYTTVYDPVTQMTTSQAVIGGAWLILAGSLSIGPQPCTLTGAGSLTAAGTVTGTAALAASGALTSTQTIGGSADLAAVSGMFAGQGTQGTAVLAALSALVPSASAGAPARLAGDRCGHRRGQEPGQLPIRVHVTG